MLHSRKENRKGDSQLLETTIRKGQHPLRMLAKKLMKGVHPIRTQNTEGIIIGLGKYSLYH